MFLDPAADPRLWPASASEGSLTMPMTDDNAAIDNTQTDEDILSYTVSDETLEAAAVMERGVPKSMITRGCSTVRGGDCC
jgi:hypothetical protein